jgi:hypothetical protein
METQKFLNVALCFVSIGFVGIGFFNVKSLYDKQRHREKIEYIRKQLYILKNSPMLTTKIEPGPDKIKLTLINAGIGSALLNNVMIVPDLTKNLLDKYCEELTIKRDLKNHILGPGREEIIFSCSCPTNSNPESWRKKIIDIIDQKSIKVDYSDSYENNKIFEVYFIDSFTHFYYSSKIKLK